MDIHVQRLLRNPGVPLEGEQEFDLSAMDFPGYRVDRPVRAAVKAVAHGTVVTLALDIRAQVTAPCARCLAETASEQHILKEYSLDAADLEGDNPELPMLPGGAVDLQELVYGELLIEVPGAILCREDCEGLCQRCGKPKADCTCPDEPEGDPRMQVLKQLL